MKQIRFLSALVALAVLAVLTFLSSVPKHIVPAVYASSGCSDATLTGNYAFTFSGWATAPPSNLTEGKSSIPTAAVGVATFDGQGNVNVVSITTSHNGTLSTSTSVALTYTVNSDCTGTIDTFVVAILGGGMEVRGLDTTNDTASTLEVRKQDAKSCTDATLAGKYVLTLTGFGTPPPFFTPGSSSVPLAGGGVITFDGVGSWTASLTLSHNGDITAVPPETGTYTVNSDCTGTIAGPANYATAILAAGTEVYGIETDVGTTATVDLKKQ